MTFYLCTAVSFLSGEKLERTYLLILRQVLHSDRWTVVQHKPLELQEIEKRLEEESRHVRRKRHFLNSFNKKLSGRKYCICRTSSCLLNGNKFHIKKFPLQIMSSTACNKLALIHAGMEARVVSKGSNLS